jgi:predicted Zn-dependent peptidase
VTGDWIETETDGVATFVRPKEGPTSVGLVFRVGFADEAVPLAGITHLVEHLALHPIVDGDVHANGATELVTTTFLARGRGSELSDFLGRVCRNLRQLPEERLTVERNVLRAEARDRGRPLLGQLLAARYGFGGYGRPGLDEHGLGRFRFADVQAWADHWFTADNAVLWILGTPPEDLSLRLPRGERIAPPRASSVWPDRLVHYGLPVAALSLEVPDDEVAAVALRILSDRCFRHLRLDRGHVYDVSSSLVGLDGRRAMLVVSTEAGPEEAQAVMDGLLTELGVLAVAGPEPEDLERALRSLLRAVDEPDSGDGDVAAAARARLLGVAPRPLSSRVEAWRSVTAADVRHLFEVAQSTAHLWAPPGAGVADHRYRLRGWSMDPPPPGVGVSRTVVADEFDRGDRMSCTDEGIFQYTAGVALGRGVRWAACAGVLRHPNRVRVVLGVDGTRLVVSAAEWEQGDALLAAVDAACPPDLLIDDPDEIMTDYLAFVLSSNA